MRAVERAAARAVEKAAERLALTLREALPGVAVEREGGDVVLRGRGLVRRVLDEPALRDPAGLVR